MCECGSEVYIQKTQECRRCYMRRWNQENRDKRNAYDRARYERKPMVYTAAVPLTTPCTYSGAHQRVYAYRGRASQHVCPCGMQAQEWSYRGGSSYQMSGPRRKRYDSGKWETVTSTWSTNVTDYDPLCRECHEIRDSKGFFELSTNTPAAAPQNPSLIADQRSHDDC